MQTNGFSNFCLHPCLHPAILPHQCEDMRAPKILLCEISLIPVGTGLFYHLQSCRMPKDMNDWQSIHWLMRWLALQNSANHTYWPVTESWSGPRCSAQILLWPTLPVGYGIFCSGRQSLAQPIHICWIAAVPLSSRHIYFLTDPALFPSHRFLGPGKLKNFFKGHLKVSPLTIDIFSLIQSLLWTQASRSSAWAEGQELQALELLMQWGPGHSAVPYEHAGVLI